MYHLFSTSEPNHSEIEKEENFMTNLLNDYLKTRNQRQQKNEPQEDGDEPPTDEKKVGSTAAPKLFRLDAQGFWEQ